MTDEALLSSPQYKSICELASMFSQNNCLDSKAREHLSTMLALAFRQGAFIQEKETLSKISL